MNAESYIYTLPEGYVLRPEQRIKLDWLVNKCCLDNKEAQQFIDLHVEFMEEYAGAVALTIATVLPKVPAAMQRTANTQPVTNDDTSKPSRKKYSRKQ